MTRFVVYFLTILVTAAMPAFGQTQECPDLTLLQRAAGYVTLLNVAKVFGAALVGVGVLFVFGGIIVRIVYHMRILLEVLGYAASFALIASGHWLPDPAYLTWTVFIGCLLFAGTVFATLWIHNIKGDDPKQLAAIFMVVWGAVAVFYSMPEVGFLAVGALMTILGFSVIIGNLSYTFGFEDEKMIPSATVSAILLLAIFLVIHVFVPDAPPFIAVFKSGMFWIASFVGFIGLLIMSSRYYASGQNYIGMQIITVVLSIAAVGVGLVFGLNPLVGIAGTFFVLYLASKPVELPQSGMTTFGITLMLSGGIVYGAWWFGTKYTTLAQQYLVANF